MKEYTAKQIKQLEKNPYVFLYITFSLLLNSTVVGVVPVFVFVDV